jgi:23S rRNA pseudouridine955/2504/2580 synthase
MAGIEHITVSTDESGMRVDRWFKVHYPGLAFGGLQKLLRSGQIRVDGGRMKSDSRLQTGQVVRVPPMEVDSKANSNPMIGSHDLKHADADELLKRMLIHEDEKIFVLNKPAGIAVQGGSGVNRHIDGLLEAWTSRKGEKPRLVHRLDRDTSGVLVIARTRGAAQKLTAAFRERDTKKIYWALVKGVPRKHEDRISSWLVKEQTPDGDRMRIGKHGEQGADHAISYYRVIDTAAQNLAWLQMEPYTGRTHQLRVHALSIGHHIIGDPKYSLPDHNWEFPGGIQKRLHLHARYIDIPHPDGGRLRVTAPLSPHMVQTWNLLGLDQADGDLTDG